jgi:hypothetical protein
MQKIWKEYLIRYTHVNQPEEESSISPQLCFHPMPCSSRVSEWAFSMGHCARRVGPPHGTPRSLVPSNVLYR